MPPSWSARDALTDSALIQLTEKPNHPLPEAKFGDSSQMAAGDWVMAIGNPFNQGWTVTVGVISAMQRALHRPTAAPNEMIQTDAAINPGNSGGPLLNLRGEVIGINTMIFTNDRVEGNIGIGFAVPINTVRDLLPQLHTGKVDPRPHRPADAAGAARRLRGLRPEVARRRDGLESSPPAGRPTRPASRPATSSSSSTAVRCRTPATCRRWSPPPSRARRCR